ncbi:unnamed protein product [Arctogadus glacialis]
MCVCVHRIAGCVRIPRCSRTVSTLCVCVCVCVCGCMSVCLCVRVHVYSVISISALYLLTLGEKQSAFPDDRNSSVISQVMMNALQDGRKLYDQLKFPRDWTNTSIQSFVIKENQQVIDSRYLDGTSCGPGRVSFKVPISQYVPLNMGISLLMK